MILLNILALIGAVILATLLIKLVAFIISYICITKMLREDLFDEEMKW